MEADDCKASIVCEWEKENMILSEAVDISQPAFITCGSKFTFTDPVEELLLMELDDTFISRVSFRETAELL